MDEHPEDVVDVDAPDGGPSSSIYDEERSPTYDEERAKWEQETQSLREMKKGQEALREIRRYRVRQFYKHQNAIVDGYLNMTKPKSAQEEEEEHKQGKLALRRKQIAIYGSVVVNVFLFFIKVYATVSSGSLSVMASALDSFLDLLSGLIIFVTEVITKRTDPAKYPAGKARFEPLGIVIFATCMFTATIQLLVRSVETILGGDPGIIIDMPVLVVFVLTILLKLIAYVYCRTVTTSASALTLATDHRNDVLSNLFGVSTALISTMFWYVDPLGAIAMGIYIMAVWATTAYDQLHVITGKTAPNDVLGQLTYLACHHHPKIIGVDTVRAYYFGYNFQVEMDIILPEDMTLREAHDIGESLQNRLEDLPVVERAFVHVDWEGEHKPEHARAGLM